MDYSYYDLDRLNKKISSNKQKVVVDTESKYRGQLFKLADDINQLNIELVLLAGPTCAGKTTSARLLKEVLEKRGRHVVTVSMDDFFIDRDKTPLLPNGLKDMDSPKCVDFELMQQCFKSFWQEIPTMFPVYNFKTGKSEPNSFELTKTKETIVIFEGLHTLNPELIKHVGTSKYFKIYVSALSGFRYDDYVLMPENLRLLRRMIRDVDRRGYTPEVTLKNWSNVCDAEQKYINPYRDDADYFIDTTHQYELAIYRQVFLGLKERGLVTDVVTESLSEFLPVLLSSENIDRTLIPDTSMMWEFVDKPDGTK